MDAIDEIIKLAESLRKEVPTYELIKELEGRTLTENQIERLKIIINSFNVMTTDQITILTFEEFWKMYDKKVGDKRRLIKKWEKISEEDRAKIKDYIPLYVQSQPDKKFRKNPETFINQKSWNDEIIRTNQTPTDRELSEAIEIGAILDKYL